MDPSTVLNTIKRDLESKIEDVFIEDHSGDEAEPANLIIQNFSLTTDKRVEITSMFATIMAQRELDQQKIIALNKENTDLDKNLSRVETQLHYLRLDLNNKSIQHLEAITERDLLKTQTDNLKTKTKDLEKKLNTAIIIDILLGMLSVIILLLNFLAI